jgi:hypothetical protein
MSRPQQNAVIQEFLDQNYVWRKFVAMKHALIGPPETRNVIQDEPMTIPIADKVETNVSEVVKKTATQFVDAAAPVVGAAVAPVKAGLLTKLAIGLALPIVGAGGFAAVQSIVNRPAAVMQPAAVPDGALIPWLRDNGYNLPPPVGQDGAK